MKGVIFFLLSLLFFTSSFDVLGQINIGGFNLKLSYMVILLLIFLFLVRLKKVQFKFRGFLFFGVWMAFLLLFIGNTKLLSRNIVYFYSLCQFTLVILIIADFVKTRADFYTLQRVYLRSFVFVALFGLVQLCAGIAGVPLLVAQWWIEGSFPRLNGFSYEPSYFATYLLIGWSHLFGLLQFGQPEPLRHMGLSTKQVKWYLYIITAAMILSSSRMGIVFIVGMSGLFFAVRLAKNLFVKGIITKTQLVVCTLITAFIIAVIPLIISLSEEYAFLLSGTGIGESSSHSVDIRGTDLANTIAAAKKSVFIGVGLGGIPSAVAESKGIHISNGEDAKAFEGLNVFVELFASSSLTGFLFFMLYIVIVFHSLLNRRISLTDRPVAYALALALFSELLILCLNQNILRPYLWIHIGIANSFIFLIMQGAAPKPDNARLATT